MSLDIEFLLILKTKVEKGMCGHVAFKLVVFPKDVPCACSVTGTAVASEEESYSLSSQGWQGAETGRHR